MIYTATALRKDIYTLLDSVLESGIPLEIERKGRKLRIVPEEKSGRLSRLEPHSVVTGNSDDLPDIHFDQNWSGGKDL